MWANDVEKNNAHEEKRNDKRLELTTPPIYFSSSWRFSKVCCKNVGKSKEYIWHLTYITTSMPLNTDLFVTATIDKFM